MKIYNDVWKFCLSLCESPVSMAICPLSCKSRHIFSEYIYFLFERSTLRINRIHHKNCQRHPNKGEGHHLIGTRFFTIKRHSQQEHQRRANVLKKPNVERRRRVAAAVKHNSGTVVTIPAAISSKFSEIGFCPIWLVELSAIANR